MYMKFKVGDKVKIKDDLKIGIYDNIKFESKMEKYKGNILTVKELIQLENNNYNYYILDNCKDYDDKYFIFSDSMLEFEEMKYDKIYAGNLLKLIQENPDAIIVMFAGHKRTSILSYYFDAFIDLSIKLEYLAPYKCDEYDLTYIDRNELYSIFYEEFHKNSKYAMMSKDEYAQAINDYINSNYIFKKCICIYGDEND